MSARPAGRVVVAAVLTTLALVGGPVAATASAAPGAPVAAARKSSWKTVRTVDFNGSSLPTGCGAYSGRYSGGQSAWSSKAVDLDHGVLKLSLQKKKTSGQPYTSGGIGCWGWAQKYGRYEIRARVPAGKGIDSNIALWPSKGDDKGWTGVELLAPGPETAYVTNGNGKQSDGSRVTGDYSGAYHTYVIEWAPKHVLIRVDGKQIYFSDQSYTKARWFGLVVSNGDELTGVPDASTKLPAEFRVAQVKISSYTGVPPRAGTVTPAPTPTVAAPTTAPTTSPPAVARAPVTAAPSVKWTAANDSPALAGGVWPWLLGGSLIAAGAAATLNHPRLRRKDPEP